MTPLLNVSQTARLLSVAPKTIRRWVAEGRIEVVKADRKLLFTQAAIETFIRRNTIHSTDTLRAKAYTS